MVAFPEFALFAIAFSALFLLPGLGAGYLIFGREDLDAVERLALAFALSLGLLIVPFLAALVFSRSWNFILGGWAAVTLVIIVGAFAARHQSQHSFDRKENGSSARHNRIAISIFVIVISLSAILTLYTPRDEDDWTYYQIVRGFADASRFAPPPLSAFRTELNVWWFSHAFLLHVFDFDIARLGRDYFPFVLVPISLMAFYALARALLQNRIKAIAAVGLQLAFYLLDFFYHEADVQLAGGWVLGRIDQDHTAVQFILLPLYALAVFRYMQTARFSWLGFSFLTLLTMVSVHPQGLVQAAITLGGFLLLRILFSRQGQDWKRGGLLLLPYVLPMLALLPFLQFWYGYIQTTSAFDLSNLVDASSRFPYTFRWITFFSSTAFTLRPDLLAMPLLLSAVLLTAWLFFQLRKDLTANYLFGLMICLIVILFNPVTFGFLSNWLGWGVYRLFYLFPSTLVVVYGGSIVLGKFAQEWERGRQAFLSRNKAGTVFVAACIILVAIRIPAYLQGAPTELGSGHALPGGASELLAALRLQAIGGSGGTVLAPREISDPIPAYHSSLTPVLFRYNTPIERISDVDQFYSDTLLTNNDFEILAKYRVNYLVIPADREIVSQFDLMPFYFVPQYRNEKWTLYAILPPPQEEALVRANTTFVYGEWQSAIDEYRAILVGQGNPAEPVQRIDQSVWQVFLPFASQFYDSTQSVEEIQKQQTGRLSLAHTGLGMVLELSNLPRKAIGEFEQAVKLEPGNLQAHYHLAKLYQRLGMDQEAQIHAQAAGPVFSSDQK